MTDINEFSVSNNRVYFELDGEDFTVKYPDEYVWSREYLDLMKDIALCAWANKLAFSLDDENYLCFDVSSEQVGFWKWIAYRVHCLDVYQSGDNQMPKDLREVNVETGSDPSSLVPVFLPEQDYSGALTCQSTGKESVATNLILKENGIGPIYSMFYEYPSRAATHKISGREEYESYFDNPTVRVWSDTNTLQSTLERMTHEFEPVTCFWEIMYAVISTPLCVEHGLKYLMMGNQRDTGEAFPSEEFNYVAFEEINQAWIFEQAYSDYLHDVHDVPVVHSSNVRPFTGYGCRKIIAEYEPDFLQYMQNCLRPKPSKRWCLRCYKCNNSWVEFLACEFDPADAGLSHDVLVENPHFAANREDYGFSFPRYDRDEHVWADEGGSDYFYDEVEETLTREQSRAFDEWRRRQESRVDLEGEKYEEMVKNNGTFIEPIARCIPDEIVNDMGLPHVNWTPEALDPNVWSSYASEWRSFY